MPNFILLTSPQAKELSYTLGMASQMAEASSCMVKFDWEKLNAYPIADKHFAVIEECAGSGMEYQANPRPLEPKNKTG